MSKIIILVVTVSGLICLGLVVGNNDVQVHFSNHGRTATVRMMEKELRRLGDVTTPPEDNSVDKSEYNLKFEVDR